MSAPNKTNTTENFPQTQQLSLLDLLSATMVTEERVQQGLFTPQPVRLDPQELQRIIEDVLRFVDSDEDEVVD